MESEILRTCNELNKILVKLPVQLASYTKAVDAIKKAALEGNKILICGNGGSLSQAQHFSAELVVRYRKGGRGTPIAAIALGSDSAVLTAAGNDLGYACTLVREVEALGRPGDVLIAISTSGESPNILRALYLAEEKKMVTIGLSGIQGFGAPCKIVLNVPSLDTPRIQEAHMVVIHSICEALEK